MRLSRLSLLPLLLLAWCYPDLLGAQPVSLDPAIIRDRIRTSIGSVPWKPASGYQCSGQFVLKCMPEEIAYRALFARMGDRRLADFSSENRSWNMRYGAEGERAWTASPEITAEIEASRLPFPVQFDFPMLFSELLDILYSAQHSGSFHLVQDGREIYVTGKLSGGEVATFFLNSVEFFPRKVSIRGGSPVNTWLFAAMKTDGSPFFSPPSEPSTGCELWFSDWSERGSYRYPLRTDYVQNGEVTASFTLENGQTMGGLPAEWQRPEKMPWLKDLAYRRAADAPPALYLAERDFPSFRARLADPPWSEWSRTNALAAAWGFVVRWIGPAFRRPPSVGLVVLGLGIVLLGYTILIARRFRRWGQRPSWALLAAFVAAGLAALIATAASRNLHSAEIRALLGLHSSMRHVITGDAAPARRARRFLSDLSEEAPAASLVELGKACQAHALAYDFIRIKLDAAERRILETSLFEYARPLYGALQGWRSNTTEGIFAAAGLGMTGLAIGSEPYVAAARRALERVLDGQVTGGLHRAGPGPGAQALNSAANLFYALRRTERADYFRHPSFQQYISTSLQLSSPLGTLPLFGDTDPNDADPWSALLLKVADHMPQDTGQECVSAAERYWRLGRYGATGARKLILHLTQPYRSFYSDPYVMFLYERTRSEDQPPSASAVLGNGQAAVLRSGSSPDSIYLALNATGWGWSPSHRDILSFDLYAYRALLLHGAGFPGRMSPLYAASAKTESANSITLNGQSQSGTRCSGITACLLNQPLFDHIRALADKTYDFGQVQRDVVMVRPDKDHAGYFVLVDDVLTTSARTSVEWYLHGKGEIATGVDRISRWRTAPLSPPRWRTFEVTLAAFPAGTFDTLRSLPGVLYSRNSLCDGRSETLSLQWMGSRRVCTVLFPGKPGVQEPVMHALEAGNGATVGASDLVSLGDKETSRTEGPLTHSSEYVVLRNRGEAFPALLMVSGTAVRAGAHSIFSTKPVTVSLDGLHGGIVTTVPDTRVELRSPEIKAGESYLLDGEPVSAPESGILSFLLGRTGAHELLPEMK